LLFEKRCSRFLPGSELSAFNRAAGVRQQVTPEFRDVLAAARRMADDTDGLFNPFVLPALQRAGYRHSLVPGHQDDNSDDVADRRVVAADKLEVGADWARIPYGTAIDLGGCGKGYIGDVLARQALEVSGLQGFWFAIGGDVISYGKDDQGQPWTIYLQPDPKSDDRIGEVAAPDGGLLAVATSTSLYRRGTHSGKDWHHIIDPRSGQAAESDVTVATICDSSLLKADVLASCAIITGSQELEAWLRPRAVQAAAWLASDSTSLHTIGPSIKAY
jgi:thiamine biosynthesis lipoprotein